MKNNLIYQYYIHDKGLPDWVVLSVNHFKNYAMKHNVEYMFNGKNTYVKDNFGVVNDETYQKIWVPYFEILRLIFDPYFDKFDDILYVDCDILIDKDNENIFDLSDGENLSVIKEKSLTREFNRDHFNSGVILMPKSTRLFMRDNFKSPQYWYDNIKYNSILSGKGGDEFYLNDMVHVNNMKLNFIPLKWNVWYPNEMKELNERNFIHFSNDAKKHMLRHFFKYEGEKINENSNTK